jgi:hypothetical protein
MRTITCTFLVALSMAAPARAQAAPGDWIVATFGFPGGSIHSIAPSTGVATRLAGSGPETLFFNALIHHPDNRDFLGAFYEPEVLARVVPNGPVTTVAPLGRVTTSIALDEDGTVVATISLDQGGGHLVRANLDTHVTTLIAAVPVRLNAVGIDGDTGDWIVGSYDRNVPDGLVLRIDRSTRAVSTIATGVVAVTAVGWERSSGDFLVANGGSIVRVTRGGSVAPFAGPLAANELRIDPENGNVLVGGLDQLTLLSPAGAVITTRTPPPLFVTGVELFGSREVSGAGSLRSGSSYRVDFAFPGSPNSSYVAALSLAPRPGFPLPDGRVIPLALDPLFVLSLGGLPGITTGFAGRLDAQGRAQGTIALPPGFPAGVRVFASAVALNPALPSGLDTANVLGVTTE